MTGLQELLAANRFYLELKLEGSDTSADATFLECQGFKRSQESIEISEVTPEKWGQANLGRFVRTKIPGGAKTENIILRRGMTGSMTFWKWFEAVESGKWAKQLRNGSLVIYDQGGQEQARFDFQNAWPVRYTAADVSAQSTDLEIEELEIAVDNFIRVK
ncbi:MAG: phage tail protein [Kaiparowitsia implicata GSE-PSE-MK54-09C]|jgi:phage tail-like protein|nr:phage tail protein [Kaiparowitsia implicata GSE-PSE-MK54-09C]